MSLDVSIGFSYSTIHFVNTRLLQSRLGNGLFSQMTNSFKAYVLIHSIADNKAQHILADLGR